MVKTEIFVDKFPTSRFIETGYESNGHDCWGNSEYSSHNFVMVKGEKERIFEGMFVIHNDEEALAVAFDWNLDRMVYEAKKELGNRLQLRLFEDGSEDKRSKS
jgi:hypothetical protein